MLFLSKQVAAVAWIHSQGRLVRAVGKTTKKSAVKFVGAQDKLWVSNAKQNEAGIKKKENGMIERDYRPSF